MPHKHIFRMASLRKHSIADKLFQPKGFCYTINMSERCLRCFRPQEYCYCKYIVPVHTDTKFVFLMHPKEAFRQRTGTGRLAHLSLPDSEILIGVDFSKNTRLCTLLTDPAYYPLLLYSDNNALTAQSDCLKTAASNKRLLIIIVDATWFFAKKIIRLSENLHTLQKLSFKNSYHSQFLFKHQPAPECLSTIESCYYLIQELKDAGIVQQKTDAEPLMRVFKTMIQFQLNKQHEREKSGGIDRYALAGSLREKKRRKRQEAALHNSTSNQQHE